MKISEFLDNAYNRYSFQFFSWSVWFCLLVNFLILLLFILCGNLSIFDSLGCVMIIGPSTTFQIIITFETVLCLLLLKKESIYPEWRVKSEFINSSIFYRKFVYISFFLSVIVNLVLLLSIISIFFIDWLLADFLLIPSLTTVFSIIILGLITNAFFVKEE